MLALAIILPHAVHGMTQMAVDLLMETVGVVMIAIIVTMMTVVQMLAAQEVSMPYCYA